MKRVIVSSEVICCVENDTGLEDGAFSHVYLVYSSYFGLGTFKALLASTTNDVAHEG